MRVRIVWKACAEGRWRRGEDVTNMDKLVEPEKIDALIDEGDGSDRRGSGLMPTGCNRWTRENMPNFHRDYVCGTNPVNYEIIR